MHNGSADPYCKLASPKYVQVSVSLTSRDSEEHNGLGDIIRCTRLFGRRQYLQSKSLHFAGQGADRNLQIRCQ